MQIRTGQMGALLLIFLAMSGPALAQDIDAKIKRLEELEARVDAKLKRLESLEARLESRLETGVQPVAFGSQAPALANGHTAAAIGMASAAATGSPAPWTFL